MHVLELYTIDPLHFADGRDDLDQFLQTLEKATADDNFDTFF